MNDSLIIENILLENNLSQQQLASILGCKKQAISQVTTGARKISSSIREKIREHFPDVSFDLPKTETKEWLISLRKSLGITQSEFAERIGISQTLYSKLEKGNRTITQKVLKRIKDSTNQKEPVGVLVRYCPDCDIAHLTKTNNKIVLDKSLLVDGADVFNPDDCCVITLRSDALKPMFSWGDKVIAVFNQKNLVEGGYYILRIDNNYYARRITILPNKIKCISTENPEDTFYLSDTKGAQTMCRIIPQIRL